MPPQPVAVRITKKVIKYYSWDDSDEPFNLELELSRSKRFRPRSNSGGKIAITRFLEQKANAPEGLWVRDLLAVRMDFPGERGRTGRMGHIAYLIGMGYYFLIHPEGDGTGPSGRNCLTNDQIEAMWRQIEETPDHLRLRRIPSKVTENLLFAVFERSIQLVYLPKEQIGPLLPRGVWQYKRNHWVRFSPDQGEGTRGAYIDFVIRVPGGLVLKEGDENQHKDREDNRNSGDMRRIGKIMETLWSNGITEPILVLRSNPHDYQIEDTRTGVITRFTEENHPMEARMEDIRTYIESLDLTDAPPFQIEHRHYDAIIDENGNQIARTTLEPTYQEVLSTLENHTI